MIATAAVRLAALAGLAVLAALRLVNVAELLGVLIFVNVGACLFDPAAQAVLGALTDGDDARVARAQGLYVQLDMAGQTLAPPVASALFTVARAVPFAADAASYLVSGLLAWMLPADHSPGHSPGRGGLTGGIRHLAGVKELRVIIAGFGAFNVAASAATATLVLYVREVLGLPVFWYGVIIGAGGVVGIAAGWAAPRWCETWPAPAVWGAALGTLGAGLAAAAVWTSPWAAGAAMAVLAVGATGITVLGMARITILTPLPLQARANSVMRIVATGGYSLGALAGGVVASQWGLRAPFAAAGALAGLLAVVFAWWARAGPPLSTVPGPRSPGR